jgi:hypothetical protein
LASVNELASSVASTSKCSRPPSWPIAAVPCEMQSVWRNAAVRVKTSALNFGLPALAGVSLWAFAPASGTSAATTAAATNDMRFI